MLQKQLLCLKSIFIGIVWLLANGMISSSFAFELSEVGVIQSPKAVLVLNYNDPTEHCWFLKTIWQSPLSSHEAMASQFVQYFESEYGKTIGTEVVKSLDQYVLSRILRDPNVVAVFVASHVGILTSRWNVFQNYLDPDFREVFKTVHPNLKWFSFLGSNGRAALESLQEDGYFDSRSNPQLSLDGRLDEVNSLQDGLETSLREFKKTVKSNISFVSYATKDFGIPLRIIRKTSKRMLKYDYPAVRVEIGDQLVAVFPKMTQAGEFSVSTYFKTSSFETSSLKIVVSAGMSLEDTQNDLGEFSFGFLGRDGKTLPFDQYWKQLKDLRIREVRGQGIYSYYYSRPESPPFSVPVEYDPFQQVVQEKHYRPGR
jgi:hypothetical protein